MTVKSVHLTLEDSWHKAPSDTVDLWVLPRGAPPKGTDNKPRHLWWYKREKLLHRLDGPAVVYNVYRRLLVRDAEDFGWVWKVGAKKKKPDEWWIMGKRFKGKMLQAYKRAKTQEQKDAILGFWELQQESL